MMIILIIKKKTLETGVYDVSDLTTKKHQTNKY